MRFYEFSTIKTKGPMTPAKARIYSIQQTISHNKNALQAERDRQKRQREFDKRRKNSKARTK